MHMIDTSHAKFEEMRDELREQRVLFVIIRGTNLRRGRQIIEAHKLAGEYYIWETPNVKCRETIER